MAFIPQFRGKKREIVERSLRGETPADIVLALATSAAYVHNVRSEARGLGINFPPTNSQNPPESAREPDEVLVQDQHRIDVPEGQNVNLEQTNDQNNDLRERIRELERRRQSRNETRQLLAKETHLEALEEEDQLQTLIAGITRDPNELLRDQEKYSQAIERIMTTSPWRDRLSAVVLTHSVKFDYMIRISFVSVGQRVTSSETLVADLANDFIGFAKKIEFDKMNSIIGQKYSHVNSIHALS